MAGLFKIALDTGKRYLFIPEQRAFRSCRYTGPQYFACLQVYLQWFVAYNTPIFGTAEYTQKQIIDLVYKARTKEPSNTVKLDILKKHLFVCNMYVQELLQNITPANIDNYKHTLWRLDHDIECLVLLYEARVNNISNNDIELTSGIRKTLSPYDICCATHQLFNVENCTAISDIYLMDLKPTVTFQIRQLVELYGKYMLGLRVIEKLDGGIAKQFTQIAWKFVKERNYKSDKWHIELPFDLDSILAINDWANGFTHSAHIDSPYLQYYALKTVDELFKPANTAIITYDNQSKKSPFYAEVKIYGYNELKKDFEKFIQSDKKILFWRFKVKKHKAYWEDVENVDAYIMSL